LTSFYLRKSNSNISNCFQDHFERLKTAYPGRRLLIVSNTAGASSIDPRGKIAAEVEKSTGVPVLPHSTKKPGCGPEIMEYFRKHPETGVTRPDQIAVVGDRLTTDVMLANLMGSYAVWVKDGVVPLEQTSIVSLSLSQLLKKSC
jgi:phosphatidylglycerophosphatase GEP4